MTKKNFFESVFIQRRCRMTTKTQKDVLLKKKKRCPLDHPFRKYNSDPREGPRETLQKGANPEDEPVTSCWQESDETGTFIRDCWGCKMEQALWKTIRQT